jgi:hypothetical protein
LNEIKGLAPPRKGPSGEAVLALGERAETTEVIRLVPAPIDHWICTTFQRKRMYRNYFLNRELEKPLFEGHRKLAGMFPRGVGRNTGGSVRRRQVRVERSKEDRELLEIGKSAESAIVLSLKIRTSLRRCVCN